MENATNGSVKLIDSSAMKDDKDDFQICPLTWEKKKIQNSFSRYRCETNGIMGGMRNGNGC